MKLHNVSSARPVTVQDNSSNRNSFNKNSYNNSVSFKGAADIMLATMDGIERGGFAASFVAQDFLGMAGPRVGKGLYRNSDETGEKNWAYATSVAIRELLSGPSLFIIPSVILASASHFFGKANRLPFDHIEGIGGEFKKFASSQTADVLKNKDSIKQGFYKEAFKNLLKTTTDNKVENVDAVAEEFSKDALKISTAKKKSFFKNLFGKPVENSKEDLTEALLNKFIDIKKKYGLMNGSVESFSYNTEKGKLGTTLPKFIEYISNYTDDVSKTLSKKLGKDSSNIEKLLTKFNHSRVGMRFLTTSAMTLGVFSFFTIIPKLYKTKGGNPALSGLEHNKQSKVNGGEENENK